MTSRFFKRFTAIALCSTLLIFFAQCGKDLWEKVQFEACVLKYTEIKGIDAYGCKRSGSGFFITVRIKEGRTCKFNDTGASKELFDSLRTVRNDIHHTSEARVFRNGELLPLPAYNHLAFPKIKSIDVITIYDFDADHPGYSSIKEYATVNALWGISNTGKCGPAHKDAKLSVVESNSMYLECPFTINFTKCPPDSDQALSFRVIVTTEDGKKYEDTITVSRYDFEHADHDDDDD